MLAVFVCVQDGVVWRGRTYGRGEVYDGPWEESPVDQMGWGVREPSPAELSPDDTLGLHGRTTMNWRKPTTTPEVEPVVAGYDLLHGEDIIDEEATKRREIDLDEVNRRLMPKKPSEDERRKKEIESWEWAAPDQFEDFLKSCPEEARRLGILRTESAPEEVQDIPIEQQHTPPATAVELTPPPQVDPVDTTDERNLDELLKAEVQAEADGDEDRLVEIRSRIEEAMK